MTVYKIVDNQPIKWTGERINGTMYQRNIEKLWTDSELKSVGLYKVIPDELPIPEGQVVDTDIIAYYSIFDEVRQYRTFIPKPPLYPNAVDAKDRLNDITERFSRRFIDKKPDYEKEIWAEKVEAIRAFKNGNMDSDQATLIQTESAERGISEINYAKSIRDERRFQIEVMSKVSGVRQNALDAFVNVVDPYKYETILKQAQTRLNTIATNAGWPEL